MEFLKASAVRFLGEIPNTPTELAKLAKRLGKDSERSEFCYQAGCSNSVTVVR
jgi:hypothetical protein